MDLQFLKCWWKLNPADVVSISQSVTMCNHINLNVTRRIGQWVYINLHDVKTEGMKQFLALYSHIISNDEHFIRALERFFIAKSNKLDTSVVMMAMDYLRQIRHLSPKIFDIAASHFVQNSALYSPLQMFYVVRPFGYLNYTPKNEIAFFGEVEKILEGKFWKTVFYRPHSEGCGKVILSQVSVSPQGVGKGPGQDRGTPPPPCPHLPTGQGYPPHPPLPPFRPPPPQTGQRKTSSSPFPRK